MKALSPTIQKLCLRLKFLWLTDTQMDGQIEELVLMSPCFRKSVGQKKSNQQWWRCQNFEKLKETRWMMDGHWKAAYNSDELKSFLMKEAISYTSSENTW